MSNRRASHHTLAALGVALALGVSFAPTAAAQPAQTVKQIAAGFTGHTNCAIVADDSVRCWGSDRWNIVSDAPEGAFTKVSVNRQNACGLDTDGAIHCWGRDLAGVVSGVPAGAFVDFDHMKDLACAIDAGGDATCWGNTLLPAAQVPVGAGLTSISIAYRHGCGVNGLNEAVCWGNDAKHVISDAPLGANFTQVEVGMAHACALDDIGGVLCWGRNNRGSVKHTPIAGTFVELSVGRYNACAVDMFGGLECWGRQQGRRNAPSDLGFVSVSTGNRNSCAVTAEGGFTCFGDDTAGAAASANKLLLGQFDRILRTAAVDGYHGAAGCTADANGTVQCWDKRGAMATAPTGSFVQLAGHRMQACGIDSEGALTCWGLERQNSTVIANQPTAGLFTEVSVALRHACAIDAAGAVVCWGTDRDGNVDDAPTSGVWSHVATAGKVSCATRADDGDIQCWGDDSDPLITDAPAGPGYGPIAMNEMFGRAQNACTLKQSDGGTIACWGREPLIASERPTNAGWIKVQATRRVACGLHGDGTVVCWGKEVGDAAKTITDVPAGSFIDLSVASSGGACAIDSDRRVHCWGQHMRVDPWEEPVVAAPLPSIVDSVFPEQGAGDMPINTALILNTNVPVTVSDYTSGFELRKAGDDSLVEYIVTERRNMISSQQVILQLSSLLEPETEYYVVILRKAVSLPQAPYGYIGDYGAVFGDQTDPTMWRFTTGTHVDPAMDELIPESPLPSIVESVMPRDDAENVATNTPLMINFSVRVGVDPYTTWIELRRAADDAVIQRIDLEPIHMLDNQTLGVLLDAELEPLTSYYVIIERKAFRVDEAPFGIIGNYTPYFDGNSFNNDMWNFTTGEGADPALDSPFGEAELPQIIDSVEPADNAIDVPVDAQLVMNLNVPVLINEYTTYIELHRLEDGALIEQIHLQPSDMIDGQLVVVTPSAPLDPDTEYYVTMDRRAMSVAIEPYGYLGDYTSYVDGNAIHPTMWNFRTASL